LSEEPTQPEEQEPEAVEPEATESEAPAEETVEVVEEAVEEPAAEVPAPKAEKKEAGEEAIPGADLVPDIVPEGETAIAAEESPEAEFGVEVEADSGEEPAESVDEVVEVKPIANASIDLAKGSSYSATGKRKRAIARVTIQPGKGEYVVNGRTMEDMFPRITLQRDIRQPLEAVGYEDKIDVIASIHGGGVSAQADALRHGISRALVKADPNLRGELKRRGFLTRDPRVVERKKAGLKKARKRPQFSKR
jgi:small subunit ribosomal protein S9